MPKIEMIDPVSIPVTRGDRMAVQNAVEQLQQALRGNQALVLRLGPEERTSRFYSAYKAAAKQLGVGVAMTHTEPRVYTSVWKGVMKEKHEYGVLYVRITKASTQLPPRAAPTADALPRRPITITDPVPTRDAVGALVSR